MREILFRGKRVDNGNQTGEKFDLSDVEQIHTVLHFCDRSAVEQTIDALE